jgi:hypothetical protein
MRRAIVLAVGLVMLATAAFNGVHRADAAYDPVAWVDDLAYGSRGGGFYHDFTSGQNWTAERGWHLFSPQPPRTVNVPLWADYLTYGSAGRGFYLDPLSGLVWTAERGWHRFDPGGAPKPPTPTPEPLGRSFGSGKKLVGEEVRAGATYRTRTANESCYWQRLTGLGGTLREIAANDNTDGPAIVTIGPNDVAFDSTRCGRWTEDLSAITSDPSAPFKGDGTYIVNVDIAPGLWKSDGAGSCYWARLSNFSGTLKAIIANDNATGPTFVQIGVGDTGFLSSGCGTWRRK